MDKFANRRSVRKYTDREVSDALLNDIVAVAMRAPTCGNMQLYTVIATRSAEGKRNLAPMHFNQPMATEAPVVLTVCADFARFTQWCKVSNADPGYDNFLSFITAMSDATIFAQQIVAIAEERGLGTCYLGTVVYNADKIAAQLDLPELCVPVACITLGWPAEQGEETERLPVEAVLHSEKYQHRNDDEIIDIFKAKDEYAPNRKFVEENGKDSLAQVFTDVRYTRAANEAFSESLLNYLKKSKFMG